MAFGRNDLTIFIKAKDEATNVLNKIKSNLGAHAQHFERAGKQMMLASAALSAGLGVSINQAAKFQQQMAQVSTMLDQTSMKYMPAYEKAIKRMSMEFGEGTDTLADGLYNILSASVPAEKAISVLEASVRAAKAGLTDTATATSAITTILNSYNLSVDKASDVSDLLFAIVKKGNLTFADLAPNIGKVASIAAQAGMSLEELGATISTLTRNGIRTEMSMTAIRGILNAMMKPTEEAAEAFEDKLGIAMDTTTLKAEGVIGILRRMKEVGLTPEEIAKMFPNVRALTGVVAAMGSLEGITEDYNLMVNRAGLSQEAYQKNINTTQVSIQRMVQAFNILAVTLGEQLLPFANKVIETIINFVKWFNTLSESTKKIIAGTALLATAFLGIGGAMLFVIAKIPLIVAGFSSLLTVLTTTTVGIAALKTALSVGLVGAIAFTSLELVKLVKTIKEWVTESKRAKQVMEESAKKQAEVFPTMLESFGKMKDKVSKSSDELARQATVIENLKKKYFELAESGILSAEDLARLEDLLVEKIHNWIAAYREKIAVEQQGDAERIAKKEEEIDIMSQLTDNERELFTTLAEDIELLDAKQHKAALINLEREYKARQKKAKQELKDKQKLDKYYVELEKWKTANIAKLEKELAMEKRQAAFQIADYTIQALQSVLEAEGSSAQKKKGFVIALIALEKALAIAKMWSAEATKGVLGIPLAIAGTAAIVAQFAVLMKNMKSSSKELDNVKVPKMTSVEAPEEPELGVASGGFTGGGGVGYTTPTTSAEGGGGYAGGGGGGVSKIININVGGIDVNFGIENLGEVQTGNIETFLRDVGEAVKSKTVEAVTFAMRTYNLGKELEGEAT